MNLRRRPALLDAKGDLRIYDRIQRLYHWETTGAFVGLLVTGFAT